MANMHELTRGMVWLKGLGTMHDKTERLERFCGSFEGVRDLDIEALKRAALLCKADLLSSLVREKEFTSLQGIAGYYYAKAANEGEKAALAIRDHYLPAFVGDAMPATIEGTALSIADKVDNVVGAFLSGQKPSGSYDPLGVRRNGYAVFNMLDAGSLDLSLFDKVDALLKIYEKDSEARSFIYDFFQERLSRYLQDKDFRYDEIDAVLTRSRGNAFDARLRCVALKNLRGKQDFVQLVVGQKRVRNILKGIEGLSPPDPALFEQAAEKTLYERGNDVAEKLTPLLDAKNYADVLRLLLGMRGDIDKFFDDVMVMCEDKLKQKNRLGLVGSINELFIRFADLSKIVIEGEKDKKEA
jgi:glycyl-tRNA synthetase beta chain